MQAKRYRFNLDQATFKRIDTLINEWVRRKRRKLIDSGMPAHQWRGGKPSRQAFVRHIVRRADIQDAIDFYDGGRWGNFSNGPTRTTSLPFTEWELEKLEKVAGGNRSAALRVIVALAEVERL